MQDYDQNDFYCELLGRKDAPADHAKRVVERLARMSGTQLARRARAAERELFNLGITFTVYSDKDSIDRILPFDVVPRILSRRDWTTIAAGVVQRVAALNYFLADIYGKQRILKNKVIPDDLVLGNANYRPEMIGVPVAFDTYVHICGIDIVRDDQGQLMVLEDNARTPSGVSYAIENRHLMLRASGFKNG
ncbi:MAG TPA: circularly permuted type 2 ATP-grasp protein [Alphaproteobacteria bacterium]|nr:circularly permuted type 2 ATP-grasp protein [Alphaproteobacteria bacterium]